MANINNARFDFNRQTPGPSTDFFRENISISQRIPDSFSRTFRNTIQSTIIEENTTFGDRRECPADDCWEEGQSLCVNQSADSTSEIDRTQFTFSPGEFQESMGASAKEFRDQCFSEWNHRNADTTTENILWDLRRLALANDRNETKTSNTTATNYFSDYPPSIGEKSQDEPQISNSNTGDFFKSPESEFKFSDGSQSEQRAQSTFKLF